MDGSFVEYLYSPNGPSAHKCGYCKSPDTSMTQGIWAYKMSCRDYQDLVDRGFQRSGKYVYRPVMRRTCCPQYVVRLDSRKFLMSKAQRKTVKKMRRYLVEGLPPKPTNATKPAASAGGASESGREDVPSCTPMEEEGTSCIKEEESRPKAEEEVGDWMRKEEESEAATTMSSSQPSLPATREGSERGLSATTSQDRSSASAEPRLDSKEPNDSIGCAIAREDPPGDGWATVNSQEKEKGGDGKVAEKRRKQTKKPARTGAGPDPTKPRCRKAKVMRRERKAQKHYQHQGNPKCQQAESDMSSSSAPQPFTQNLEELIAVPHSQGNAHHFSTRLVCCSPRSPEFELSFQESYAVFQKFQTVIHKEKPEDCGERQFTDFLVDSPMRQEEGPAGMPGYGSYHMQYLIDGKIFAVGVLDLLPRGVLCEYLYYDPAYRFIAPGVYTALQEIALTQKYYQLNPDMQFYYMGFYVQSCPKMNYKARYSASFLLCTETYQYVPLEKCVPKLLVSEYSRLADADAPAGDPEEFPEDGLDQVMVIADMKVQPYGKYRLEHGNERMKFMEEYVQVIGMEVALRLKVFLGRMFF